MCRNRRVFLGRFLTAGLLLFVAASIATPIVRHVTAGRREAAADAAPGRPDALVVYYFRGNVRCAACRTLEACSREVVGTRFSAEVADGRIEWRAIDYESPGNEHWLADYQLLTGGVVLVKFRDGHRQRWKALTETWNMTRNREALARYLEEAIRTFDSRVGFSPPSHNGGLKPTLQHDGGLNPTLQKERP
jgi:hypothetical protein